MSRVETPGAYRGTITSHGLSLTKNGFPQFGFELAIKSKYVEDAAELAHFQITEPAWVDYSAFGQTTQGYLVLFKDKDVFDDSTKLMNYEQLVVALGWSGAEFNSLNGTEYVNKDVLVRIDENTYNDKVSYRVEWIDHVDASPTREVRKLATDLLASLASKLTIGAKPKAAPPKPASAPAKAAPAAAPAAKPAAPAAAPAATTPAPAPAAAPPASAPPAAAPAPTAAPAAPAITDKMGAWTHLVENKGASKDKAVEEAWIKACSAVSAANGNCDETAFTSAHWGEVAVQSVAALA